MDGLTGWSARDYVLERRFCPIEDIENTLGRYRAIVGASEVVLLALDRYVLFQSISCVAHAGTPYGKHLAEAIRTIKIRRRDPSDANPLWREISTATLDKILLALADAALYEGGDIPTFLNLLVHPPGDLTWRVAGETFVPEPLWTANVLILQRGGQDSPDSARQVVETCAEQANGTPQASIHRDRVVTANVQHALNAISTAPDEPHLNILLPSLLSMAKNVTESSGAAVYFAQRPLPDEQTPSGAPARQVLVAAATDTDEGLTLRSQRVVLARKKSSNIVGMSFTLGLPLLAPVPRAVAPQSASAWTIDIDDGHQIFELAVPIPTGIGGGAGSNQGVVTLCRLTDGEPNAYGGYELALLRNVALRIALLRASFTVSDAAAVIASTGRIFAVAEPTAATRPAAAASRPALPPDIAPALDSIRAILGLAAQLTDSHSVTFRVLVPRWDARERVADPALLRVAACPDSGMQDDHARLPLRVPSVNTWVAQHGLPCYISNFATVAGEPDPRPIAIGRRRSQSELCTPIFVDQRLVGTLNFESRFPNTYVLQSPIAEACAAQIAMAIAAERRRHLRDVVSIGSDVQAAAHELRTVAKTLNGLTAGRTDAPVDRSLLKGAATSILEIINTLGPPTDRVSANWRLDQIVQEAVTKAGIRTQPFSIAQLGPWDAVTERRLYLVFYEIFRNVDRHAELSAGGTPVIEDFPAVLGGRHYTMLAITQAIRSGSVPPTEKLYRVPLSADDGVHFGAFTAGAIMRTLGGDIHAIRLARNRLLTLVSCPHPRQPAPRSTGGR
jgi:hypothetical protein